VGVDSRKTTLCRPVFGYQDDKLWESRLFLRFFDLICSIGSSLAYREDGICRFGLPAVVQASQPASWAFQYLELTTQDKGQ